jgi:DNA-binding SARP family transcriptional activator
MASFSDRSGGEVELLILGPIAVAAAGRRPTTIASSNQRVVLAMLLLETGRVVTVSNLVDAVWDDSPPPSARNQVQTCVSKLRKHLAAVGARDLIVTDPAGYMIRDTGVSLDLHRFEEHRRVAERIVRSRPAEAVGRYRAGLELWRGDALGDVTSRLLQPAALSLNEDRLAVQEACLDLELRLGRHAQVVGELTGLVARCPLRERFRAQLMISLYRSGRQVEALEVFRSGREIKREEFGLDVGFELRALEHAILTGEEIMSLPELSPRFTAWG